MRASYPGVLDELGSGKVSDAAFKTIEDVAAKVCVAIKDKK